MKIMYLRMYGHPFGVLMWNNENIGWSLCNTSAGDHFNRQIGRCLALLMAANYTVDDAIRFVMQPTAKWQWKLRALKDGIRRALFSIMAERIGIGRKETHAEKFVRPQNL
jgi:hypothetical protein